jgi:hypothetical protein
MGYHHPAFQGPVSKGLCSYVDLFPIPSLGQGRDYGDGIINLDDIAILASCWLDDSLDCMDIDLIPDGIINLEDFGFFYPCWLMVDEQGPEPAEWEQVPNAVSSASIAMEAKAAFDSWGWDVEYQFERTIDIGDPCSWQELNTWGPVQTYQDDGLVTGQQYWYQFKVRDLSPNLNTSYSEILSATPIFDTEPPSPDPMTWATVPYATSSSTIAMTATTATDPSGVEYQFDETSANPGGSDRSWGDDPSYINSGLSVSTQYCYRVMARDKSINQNETGWSVPPPACATTGGTGGNLPPYPIDGNPGDRAKWDPVVVGTTTGHPRERFDQENGRYYHTMRAAEAIDPELGVAAVAYYFERITGPAIPPSGWQYPGQIGVIAREWEVEAPQGSTYCYTVKYGDTPIPLPSPPPPPEAVSEPSDSTEGCVIP